MSKSLLAAVAALTLAALSGGCQMGSQQKQLEQENSQLKKSLAETTRLLGEATARSQAQERAYNQSLEMYKQALTKAGELERQIVELRGELNASRERLAEQTGEAQRYRGQVQEQAERLKTLEGQLDQARGEAAALRKRLAELSPSSGPATRTASGK